MQTKNQKGLRICKVSQNVVAAAVLLGWMFIVLVIWVILLVVWPDGSGYSPFYWPVWVLLCPASIAGQKRETDFELSRGGSNIRSGRAHIHFEAALVCRVQPRNEVYLSLFYRIPNC